MRGVFPCHWWGVRRSVFPERPFWLKASLRQNKQRGRQGEWEAGCFEGAVLSGGGSFPAQLWAHRPPTAPMPGLSSGAVWPRADHCPSLTHATQRGELIPATSDIPVAHLVTPGDVKLGCLKGMPKAKVSKPFA